MNATLVLRVILLRGRNTRWEGEGMGGRGVEDRQVAKLILIFVTLCLFVNEVTTAS